MIWFLVGRYCKTSLYHGLYTPKQLLFGIKSKQVQIVVLVPQDNCLNYLSLLG